MELQDTFLDTPKPQGGHHGGKKGKAVTILIIAAVVVVAAAVFLIYRLVPTGRHMSGYDYFEVAKDTGNEYVIIMDNEKVGETALMIEGHLYFPRKFTFDNLNKRFYFDKDSDAVIKTDGTTTWTFKTGSGEYVNAEGTKVDNGFPVIVEVDGELYVSAEFAVQDGGFAFAAYTEPQRVILKTKYETYGEVVMDSDTEVRYRGGIKSPVLENVREGDRLIFRKDVGGWIEVLTPSGFIGYVKSDKTRPVEEIAVESFSPIKKYVDVKENPAGICITWYQLSNRLGNDDVDAYLTGVETTDVISPTWFAVTDDKGTVTDAGSKTFVEKMHSRGIKVWGLVNDFATDIDRDTFLESRAVRTKIIRTLMNAADRYGLDGINIDFEKISKPGSEHYLQFMRELSLECKARGLVLSVDDPRPYSFNYQYEVGEKSAYVDYIILMAYDEHYNGSEPGSVASIGFTEEGIKAMFRSGVDKNQLILGVPFYTRVWFTDKAGKVTSSAVSMQTALDVLSKAGAAAQWNEECGQYFGAYENAEGQLVQVWLEEDRSIEEKLKLMSKYELAGCAQWKLGMEKKSVWAVFKKYMKN